MENWKVIVEYPSYSISSLGRVKNNTTNKVLKAVPNTFGYLQVRLYKEGQYKVFTIHQLVATYFLPIPSGDLELNHIDEDKLNNRWDNLEWVQHKDNCNHGTRNVRMANKLSKPVVQCTLDGVEIREFNSATEVERLLGYKQTAISSCCKIQLMDLDGSLNRITGFTVLIFMNRVYYCLIGHILCSKYTHSVHTNGLI